MNPNDAIREQILKFLYDRHRAARGMKGAEVGIRDLKRHMKGLSFGETDVVSNLKYLIDTEHVVESRREYSVPTKTGIYLAQEQIKFRISDKGINHFEGPSQFQASRALTGINITNVRGITVIGDRNFVNYQYGDLFRSLDLLGEEVRKSAQLTDEEKLNYQAEIETIKSQLAKPSPNRSIIREAWAGLAALATVEGVAQFVDRVTHLIGPLVG